MEAPSGQRLMIIEHDAGYAARLARALAALGYPVALPVSLDDALASARREPPALLVVDSAAFDGLALVVARELHESHGVPFVCVPVEGDRQVAARAAEFGALALLPRPHEAGDCVGGILVALARAAELAGLRTASAGLERALGESRSIGIAVGLLMERLRVDRTQAFEALREDARARRARVADVANELLVAAELINSLQADPGEQAQRLAS